MPFLQHNSPADRWLGGSIGMHPRENGDYILAPRDVLEGLGNLLFLDGKNPKGFRLGQPDAPGGRHVYVGLTPDTCMRQTTRPLPMDRPSHLINYTLLNDQPPPSSSSPRLARIPRPDAATLKALAASVSGYTGSTLLSPYWFAWAYVTAEGNLTPAGPPVAFQLDNGMSFRAPLPQDVPEGITKVALLLSEPGTSRPNTPGPMRVQRIVDLTTYHGDYYEMTGPYRYDGELAPTKNNTKLTSPLLPQMDIYRGNTAARVGRYYARITWTDANGETLPGAFSTSIYVDVGLDNGYTIRDKDGKITMAAGRGTVWIGRNVAPPNASGWKCYIYLQPPAGIDVGYSGGWRLVYDKLNGLGDKKPFPISTYSVGTQGWSGSESTYGNNDQYILIDTKLPEYDTTGISAPEQAPPNPISFGPARPSAGTLWVQVTEVVRGVESLPSVAVPVTITADQIAAVVFANPENKVPNPTMVETSPDRLPLYWKIDQTNVTAKVEDRKLLVAPVGAQTGVTGTAGTDVMKVTPTTTSYVEGSFTLARPASGTLAGSVEVVLRQINAATGAQTDTVLQSYSSPGDYAYEFAVATAGLAGIAWQPTTTHAQIIHRFAGATKNLVLSIVETVLRPFRIKPRPPSPPVPKPDQPPVIVRPPTDPPAKTVVQDPPEPPWSPETSPVRHPDRPRETGSPVETLDFEAGLPAGYTPSTAGGGAISAAPAAAIDGLQGLLARKAAAGALSKAYIEKTFPVPSGQSALFHQGSYQRNRLAVWPVAGSITMHDLCRPSDGSRFAWLEASANAEVGELTIEQDSLQAGNVSLNLDGVVTQVPVNAAKEVADLTITADMTSAGAVSITLDDVTRSVQGGSSVQTFSFDVRSIPSTGGYVYMTVNGEKRAIYVTPVSYYPAVTKESIAQQIADAGYTGYTVTRTGATLNFKANDPGPRPAPSFDPGTTGTQYSLYNVVSGTPDTAAQLAARIRGISFPGWILSQGATANVVRFTAVAAGPRVDATYNPGATGAAGSFTTVTQGILDTPATLAARIRGTVFAGWTLSQGATAAVVVFTSNAAGVRQNGSYDPQATGCAGTFKTIVQGSNAAIIARVQDANGNSRQRRIMDGLATTTVFNTDITVSGADTKRGVVHVWGSFGADPLVLLARFPDVDLTGYQAGTVRMGVTSESSAGLTWELHTDTCKPSARGLNYFREHDVLGQWLNQVFAYYRLSQPSSDELFLQPDETKPLYAVIPGATYTLSAWIRSNNPTSTRMRPLVITAHAQDPSLTYELGDVTNSPGLIGEAGWTEYQITVTIPRNCHAVSLRSKDVGAGEYVIQEIVLSPGNTPDRSGTYATFGTYDATFDIRTPKGRTNFCFWSRKRVTLGAIVESSSPGTSVSVVYRSANPDPTNPDIPGPWSASYSNPAEVPDRPFVQARFTCNGSGRNTPRITSGSPFIEFVNMVSSDRRMSTLLLPNRTELPGGTAFKKLKGRSTRPPEGRRRLPSGQLIDDPKLFPPVGFLPECELYVFTEEARDFMESNWKKPFVNELFGREACSLLFSGELDFDQESRTVTEAPDGTRYGIWVARVPYSQITHVVKIP